MDNDRTAAHLVDEPVDSIAMLRDLASSYARRIPVRTVAVVANAPLQPSSTRAELIDSCDVVFRVNGFRLDVAGEAAAVGVRADVVVFTRGVLATPWVFRDHRERLYLLNEPGRMHWEPEIIPDWWPPDLGQIPVPNREITVPLSAALGIDTTVDATWATTAPSPRSSPGRSSPTPTCTWPATPSSTPRRRRRGSTRMAIRRRSAPNTSSPARQNC